jgi:hypothetical protein
VWLFFSGVPCKSLGTPRLKLQGKFQSPTDSDTRGVLLPAAVGSRFEIDGSRYFIPIQIFLRFK